MSVTKTRRDGPCMPAVARFVLVAVRLVWTFFCCQRILNRKIDDAELSTAAATAAMVVVVIMVVVFFRPRALRFVSDMFPTSLVGRTLAPLIGLPAYIATAATDPGEGQVSAAEEDHAAVVAAVYCVCSALVCSRHVPAWLYFTNTKVDKSEGIPPEIRLGICRFVFLTCAGDQP